MKKVIIATLIIISGLSFASELLNGLSTISTADGGFKTLYNPSLLGEGGFNYVFKTSFPYENDKLYDQKVTNYLFSLQMANLGFAYDRFGSIETYTLATGFNMNEGVYSGAKINWSGKSGVENEVGLYTTFRPARNLSFTIAGENLTEANNRGIESIFGLGYRPFGEMATIVADFCALGEDFNKTFYKVGLEIEPMEGLKLSGSYSSNFESDNIDPIISGGIELSFGFGSQGSTFDYVDETETGSFSYYFKGGTEKVHNLIKIPDSKIVKLNLAGTYREEKPGFNFMSLITGGQSGSTVVELKEKIRRLSEDPEIAGIHLIDHGHSMSFAAKEEIRAELEKFKAKGKKITAYIVNESQAGYYLTSLADKIYMYPMGSVTLNGIGMEMVFFKGLLDKFGIEMQAIRHGKFKSAVEPFIRENISPENYEQLNQMLKAYSDVLKNGISKARNISIEEINSIMDTNPYLEGDEALKNKLVDGLLYEDQVDSTITNDIKKGSMLIDENFYFAFSDKQYKWDSITDKKVAIVYATGSIVTGNSSESMFGGQTMGSKTTAELIKAARTDKNVKAIVFRIDSGGGSALASDIILRELQLAREVDKKPVIISMGGMAASGGYWISTQSDRIFANNSTLTGSIGVFGMVPNLDSLYTTLGLNFAKISQNKYSIQSGDGLLGMHKLSEDEKQLLQNSIEKIYDRFIDLVAKSRNMTTEQVDELGQGRVWSGIDAKENGLVDEIGGLEEAVKYAAKMSGIDEDDLEYKFYTRSGSFTISDFANSVFFRALPEDIRESMDKMSVLKAISDNGEKAAVILPYEVNVK
ncbi:MAG: signal peptide peptidase SppA [Candidatus Delongbacteria bacterium]|nr:signal peptide peptidase SppA [Candidatus Delongbacteria bacterium]MBN2835849.1 signal peptide peptidase SppA [Candidatus Delongbacteria bacterium]